MQDQNSKPEISVIIPAYNEAKVIQKTLSQISRYMQNRFVYEIIVSDDGSDDYTCSKAISHTIEHPLHKVKVVRDDKNKGKGHAVRLGIKEAKYRLKLILDADLSIHPRELEFIHLDEEFDIIKGQRTQIVKQSQRRIIMGKIFRLLVWLITGIYMDTQSPFTLMNLPDDFYYKLSIDGFAFDVEILYLAKKRGYKIKKVDVHYYDRPDSKVTLRKTILMFFELLRIRLKK